MTTFDTVTAEVKSQVHSAIAAAARAEHAKIMGAEPLPIGFVRHVDGIEGAPEEAVKDGGVIVYDYNRLDLVVEFALQTLRQLSPTLSGAYASSHTVFVDGAVVDDIKALPPRARIFIASTVPYARKIETGWKKSRARPHVYERAERIVSRQFSNIAYISFGYTAIESGAVASWAVAKMAVRRGGRSARGMAGWLSRQPALFISSL